MSEQITKEPKVFLIADLHFDDTFMIDTERTEFDCITQMNDTIVKQWNSVVKDNDTVYVLGDTGSLKYIKLLNGNKYLVKGNHDTYTAEQAREAGFVNMYEYPIVVDEFYTFSHEPMYTTTKVLMANIFGHVHNNPMYKTVSSRSFCVSAERIGYKPIEFEYVKELIKFQAKCELDRDNSSYRYVAGRLYAETDTLPEEDKKIEPDFDPESAND